MTTKPLESHPMTPAARFAALIEMVDSLLVEWQEPQPRPAELMLKAYARGRRYIGSGDRRALQEGTFALLRQFGHLRQTLTAAQYAVNGRNLCLLQQRMSGASIEEITELCSGGKYGAAALTAVESAFFARSVMLARAEDLLPQWLAAKLKAQYGEDFPALCEALMQSAPLDLRVNVLKATREDVQKWLAAEDIDTYAVEGLPDALTVTGRSAPVSQTKAFEKGLVEVQDRGSQAVIHALIQSLPPFRDRVIIDYCAGAGGKSLALAAGLDDHARIIAHDADEDRLAAIIPRAERAGVNSIELWEKEAERLPEADLVLLDVPCSGTGTLRRHPDLAWRLTPEKIAYYQQLQRQIMAEAAPKVKRKGYLAYVTCSLLEDENNQNVSDFLASHGDFKVASMPQMWNKEDAKHVQALQFLPHIHESDGFFMVLLQRIR